MLDRKRFLLAIDICKKNQWLSRDRFKVGLNDLLTECQAEDHFWLIERLLSDFTVVGSRGLDDASSAMASQIKDVWGLSSVNTRIFAIADDFEPDGSQVVVKSLENALAKGWKGAIFSGIDPVYAFSKPSVVLVDDFVGTGEKAFKKIYDILSASAVLNVDIDVYFLSLASMEQGKNKICSIIGADNFFSSFVMKKAISDLPNVIERNRAINAMLELEYKVVPPAPYPKPKKYRNYSFGYEGSEALFWLEGFNIPNNVFPIFWKDAKIDPDYYMPRLSAGRGRRRRGIPSCERKTIFIRS